MTAYLSQLARMSGIAAGVAADPFREVFGGGPSGPETRASEPGLREEDQLIEAPWTEAIRVPERVEAAEPGRETASPEVVRSAPLPASPVLPAAAVPVAAARPAEAVGPGTPEPPALAEILRPAAGSGGGDAESRPAPVPVSPAFVPSWEVAYTVETVRKVEPADPIAARVSAETGGAMARSAENLPSAFESSTGAAPAVPEPERGVPRPPEANDEEARRRGRELHRALLREVEVWGGAGPVLVPEGDEPEPSSGPGLEFDEPPPPAKREPVPTRSEARRREPAAAEEYSLSVGSISIIVEEPPRPAPSVPSAPAAAPAAGPKGERDGFFRLGRYYL